ncbi:SGNH/GDSL hydrolase family protein [Bacillus sp. 31A1R]|uniref:SGNH/GDSL hydrolase family protein n=1 Tax=Robertmurraya mangrovi TaxID=3098077 RepID=A0ABU5J1N7_9BACI|nr:SGNH/GDSL hydrolase family protein [Bacillus sp. 31A1R]MDZ5473324.1 SGNH/GDSL hydrolase family protein [Bacillus sp. 31A1R]
MVVTVFGSSAAEGGSSSSLNGWSELLKRNLPYEREEFDSIQFIRHGNSGYSTTDLLEGKKIELVINNQPDLVIFENAMVNNYLKATSMAETQENLKEIMKMLQEGLPNSKIIIMSSNPIANSEDLNSVGLSYLDYIKGSEELIKEQKWLYFNTIERIANKLREENVLLVDILASDYVYFNDRGNHLWFESFFDYLKEDNLKN